MYLFQILLPRTDNEGRPFSGEDFERVKEELARRFDGVTVYRQAPAEGLWKHNNHTGSDEIIIFEVMTDEIDLADWQRRRSELEQQFRQDKVIIRHLTTTLV